MGKAMNVLRTCTGPSNNRWLWKNILFGKYSFPTPLSHKTYTYFLADVRFGHVIVSVFMVAAYASPSLQSWLGHITCLIHWDIRRFDAVEIVQCGIPSYTSIIMMRTPTPQVAAIPLAWDLEWTHVGQHWAQSTVRIQDQLGLYLATQPPR